MKPYEKRPAICISGRKRFGVRQEEIQLKMQSMIQRHLQISEGRRCVRANLHRMHHSNRGTGSTGNFVVEDSIEKPAGRRGEFPGTFCGHWR